MLCGDIYSYSCAIVGTGEVSMFCDPDILTRGPQTYFSDGDTWEENETIFCVVLVDWFIRFAFS